MRFQTGPTLLVLSSLGMALGAAQAVERGDASWALSFENDSWGDGNDGHYTHGTRLGRSSDSAPPWLARIFERLPCAPCKDPRRTELEFGQSIFTPNDTTRSDLIVDDRPYAGWLYAGIRFQRQTQTRQSVTRNDTVGLQLGIVGPAARADRIQTFVHERTDLDLPRGWDHQLANEPGVVLEYSRSWRHRLLHGRRLGFEAEPQLSGVFGNVRTHLGAGITLRTGYGLGSDTRARSATVRGPQLFSSFEIRRVLRDIFLDGNTWQESHSVVKEPWVGEARVGLVFVGSKYEIALAETYRSREFHGQQQLDRYGSISFTYRP